MKMDAPDRAGCIYFSRFAKGERARRASYQPGREKKWATHIVSARKSAAARFELLAREFVRSITEIDFIAASGRVHASKLIFLIAREG